MNMTKPAAVLAMDAHGATSRLPWYAEMPAQSSVNAPRPSPWYPDPTCCAVMLCGHTQHAHEKKVKIGSR
jgi:hypothetical protein